MNKVNCITEVNTLYAAVQETDVVVSVASGTWR